jgi:hypothetical protein
VCKLTGRRITGRCRRTGASVASLPRAPAAERHVVIPTSAMPRFRVMLKGSPVFLHDEELQNTSRLGFYTTRWVQAASAEDAEVVAVRIVVEELAKAGRKNPPDQPVHVAAEKIAEVSWFEMARRAPGRGFTFYPDAVS